MLLIFTIVLILGLLGFLALRQDYRSKTNRYFFLFTFFLSLWIISNYLSNSLSAYTYVLWANRLIFTSTILIIYFLYLFSLNYPKENKQPPKKRIYVIQIATLLLVILSFTPFIVSGIETFERYSEITFGFGVYFYISYFFGLLSLFIIEIINKYRNSVNIERDKIRYLLIGIAITAVGATLTNLVLPILFNFYGLSNLGPAFSIGLVFFTTLAIVKHQLFEIRVLLGKIIYYLIAAIPAYLTYFVLAYIYERNFGTSLNNVAYILGIPIAILFTMFVNWFNKYIGEYTDSHLINPGYNPLLVLEQLRERLGGTLDIERIVKESLFIIARTIRPSYQGFIIIPDNSDSPWLSMNYKREKFQTPEEFKSFVYLIQKRRNQPFTYDQVSSPEDMPEIEKLTLDRITAQLERYAISAVIPLKQDYKITGLLIVGNKEASSPYTSQEIRFLRSIADSAGLAIGRAMLYQEIQIFNETLQQKVNAATSELMVKNKDLMDAMTKLEEIRRQEKDMLDVMGHELRTPISIARNALVTLKKELAKIETDETKLMKYTDMAIESVRRQISLIEAFLSTTKLEGDRMQIDKSPLGLIDIVTKSIDAHSSMALKNNTKINFVKPNQDIFVIADKVRIQEVMDNLLNNAIKYTGIGEVNIRIYQKDGMGWVDVQDTGVGVSEKDIQNLGKKFFRARNLYNKSGNVVNPSGTGLGLFVSFNLIELMGGQKKIVSKVGEGSTFSFGFPISATTAEVSTS